MNRWRTSAGGVLEVDSGQGFARAELDAAERRLYRGRVERWREPAREHARAHGVPLAWLLGVIFAESGGDPMAGPNAKGYGGLTAIGPGTVQAVEPGSSRTTAADLHEPAWALHVGTKYLALLRRMAARHGLGDDLVSVASMYNAGQTKEGRPHPSKRSPWGLRENTGYLGRVVRAANEALGLAGGAPAPAGFGPPGVGQAGEPMTLSMLLGGMAADLLLMELL